MHSRWVLIREWEHRWLHERGVCGCDVVFPGLLTKPRVIGNVSDSDSEQDEDVPEQGGGDTIGHYGLVPGDTAETEDAQGRTQGTHIPPIFTETAAGDQQRVAIRLPSLYAAEWLADHRKLHDSGRCQCPVRFTPFTPDVGEYDMTNEEHEFLEEYRQAESRNRAINESEEEIALRMTQINETFGPFNPAAASVAASSSSAAKPIPVATEVPTPTGPRRAAKAPSQRCQNQGQSVYHQQFHHGEGHHSQPMYSTSSTSAMTTSVPFTQSQSLDTVQQYNLQQEPLYGLSDHMIQLSISTAQRGGGGGGGGGGHPYAGPPSYADNEPQPVYGPNTFVPMGIIFPDDHTHSHTPDAQVGQERGQHHHKLDGHHHQQNVHFLTSGLPPPSLLPFPGNPYCGLPMGAGPEGSEVHVPEWENCSLRRCKSVLPTTTGNEAEIKEATADTNSRTGNGDDDKVGCETQTGDQAEQHQEYRTNLGGGGHQRSSSNP